MKKAKQVDKYNGIKNTVKKTMEEKEEPKIPSYGIVNAFKTFGLNAPEGEVLYWSNQPQKNISKMLTDIRKVKKNEDEKKSVETERSSKMSPLTDEQIYALYDEYGLSKPNPVWVRKNLPNDEEKIRKYLEIEFNHKNNLRKKELSNSLKQETMIQQVPYTGQLYKNDGTGSPLNMEEEDNEYNPYHLSSKSLCKVSGDNTIWLIDSGKKTIKPFTSRKAFINYFKGKDNNFERVSEAEEGIKEITSKQFNSLIKNYKFYQMNHAIKEDGQGAAEDAFYVNPTDISNNYGKTINTNTLNTAISYILSFLDLFYNSGAISNSTYNTIKTDGDLISLYAEAFTNGGYNAEDIYRDMKVRELKNTGSADPSIANIQVISPTKTKNEHSSSSDYNIATTSPLLAVPNAVKGSSAGNYLSLPLYNLPDEAFKVISPIMDPNSAEFKAEADKVKTTYYDILKLKLQAQTEEERDYANKLWQDFKTKLDRTYNLKIGDNATTAWETINGYFNASTQSGLYGSGIMNETIDSYLKKVREANERERYNKLTEQETKEASYYRTYASPYEIQKLYEEDKASGKPESEWKSVKYGLVPSNNTKNMFETSQLKTLFPDLTDEQIKEYQGQIFDENGLFRSTKYQTLSNKLAETNTEIKQLKESTVLQKALNAEQEARDKMTFGTNTSTTPYTYEDESKNTSENKIDNSTSINSSSPTPEYLESLKNLPEEQKKEELKKLMERVNINTSTNTNNTSKSTAPVISRNLTPGTSGDDVKQLQEWLISQGYSIPAGATGYYGEQTKSAITEWQKANNIDAQGNYGYFGPISRNYIETKVNNTSLPTNKTSTTSTSIPSQPTNNTSSYTNASNAASNISNNLSNNNQPTYSQPSSSTSTTSNTTSSTTQPSSSSSNSSQFSSMSDTQKRDTLLGILEQYNKLKSAGQWK